MKVFFTSGCFFDFVLEHFVLPVHICAPLSSVRMQTQDTQGDEQDTNGPHLCSLYNTRALTGHRAYCVNADAHTVITAPCNCNAMCHSHRDTKERALCYPQAVGGFISSLVITLFYAQRAAPATHHPSHISPLCFSRASPAPLSNDILKLLSSPNSQRHPSFIRHSE